MPAKVVPIGQAVNDSEKVAIAYLRDNLPDSYTILHNFEIPVGQEIFEVDLALLTPHCVFIIDVKGTSGLTEIYGSKWYPEGRQPFLSPLAKLRQHAKAVKTLICDAHPHRNELRGIHVHAAVLMTAPDARVVDHGGLDGQDVTYLKRCLAYFKSRNHVPNNRSTKIQPLLHLVEKAISGTARPQPTTLSFREWQCEEQLGGSDQYKEYRARHVMLGKQGGTARLRVYHTDYLLVGEDRQTEMRLISNAFRTLSQMPIHPNIIPVRDFFPTEDEDAFILVTEDIRGTTLRQHIERPDLALTFDQKLRVMRDALSALEHTRQHNVVHRNLTPDAIIVESSGKVVLTGFDYARVENRESTIAGEIIDEIDPNYQAIECYREPESATHASDLFSAGLIFYELLTGERPFSSPTELFDLNAIFPIPASNRIPDLPDQIDEWLQGLCEFEAADRIENAATALQLLNNIIGAQPIRLQAQDEQSSSDILPSGPVDLTNLPKGYNLGNHFIIESRLGKPGGFAVAYKVYNTLGDVTQVLKLVVRDRRSVTERLRQEYKTLLQLPEHPNVVKVIWADFLSNPENTPFIVFEYLDGLTVEEFIQNQALSILDAKAIARQVATGLAHLHANGIYHQDIKPSNLLWTENGIKIIDFNVAVSEKDEYIPGGTRRYTPPDYELVSDPTVAQKIDRDLYALGVTIYRCITGSHPFDDKTPQMDLRPLDPRDFPDLDDLHPNWVQFLFKALSPKRTDRFTSAEDFLHALESIKEPRRKQQPNLSQEQPFLNGLDKPNYNPFVSYFQTLYSQSQKTNAGTRGLDNVGKTLYVDTLLDAELAPSILDGEFSLVIISGNAGDGKTAFIQQLETRAKTDSSSFEWLINGAKFVLGRRLFYTNYDGSQDEGDKVNDQVLLDFFAPFDGPSPEQWPKNQTLLIAINEGRLVDFFNDYQSEFPLLADLVHKGLQGEPFEYGVAVINLNLRSVVADIQGPASSIFDRFVRRVVANEFWAPCLACDIHNKCYVYHNRQTLADPMVGSKVIDRLKTLYTVTHLRSRLHITLRDLRSAIAYTIVGTKDCDEIHQLYQSGPNAAKTILESYFFNSWMGGTTQTRDRLLNLLRTTDIAEVSNPDLDSTLGFLDPQKHALARFSFSERAQYDEILFSKLFSNLPRELVLGNLVGYFNEHKEYVAMMRRRDFFERRDHRWLSMLPYKRIDRFLELVNLSNDFGEEMGFVLDAINRGEGLNSSSGIPAKLALRVYEIEKGTIRSYRLFDANDFVLTRQHISNTRFLEFMPHGLTLQHISISGSNAELEINLDVYEMLCRLNEGYMPSVEEREGFYRTLAVFKNVLSSAPYQQVLLTETGHEFYEIRRDADGVLVFQGSGS